MASNYISSQHSLEEEADDSSQHGLENSFQTATCTSAPEASTSQVNVSTKLLHKKKSNPSELESTHDTGKCTWTMGEGQHLDTSIQRLTKEVAFLTSIVLETKHSQNVTHKRQKIENETDFRHKGNKFQFSANTNAISAIDEARYALDNNNFSHTDIHLLDAKCILEQRNKMVMVADSSEYGWETVTHFQSHTFNLNEEEERRVKSAEAIIRSQRKLKAEQNAAKTGRGRGNFRGRGRGQNYQNYAPQQQNLQHYPSVPFSNMAYAAPPSFPPFPGHFAPAYGAALAPPPKPPIRCYGCSGYGHTTKTCPSPKATFSYAPSDYNPVQ